MDEISKAIKRLNEARHQHAILADKAYKAADEAIVARLELVRLIDEQYVITHGDLSGTMDLNKGDWG